MSPVYWSDISLWRRYVNAYCSLFIRSTFRAGSCSNSYLHITWTAPFCSDSNRNIQVCKQTTWNVYMNMWVPSSTQLPWKWIIRNTNAVKQVWSVVFLLSEHSILRTFWIVSFLISIWDTLGSAHNHKRTATWLKRLSVFRWVKWGFPRQFFIIKILQRVRVNKTLVTTLGWKQKTKQVFCVCLVFSPHSVWSTSQLWMNGSF